MKLRSHTFNLLIAAYFSVFLNFSVLQKLFCSVGFISLKDSLFLLSIPIFFIAVHNIFFTIFAIPKFEKTFVILNILISSLCSYAIFFYKILFDYSMFLNIINTNTGEAQGYISISGFLWLLVLGVVPAIFVMQVRIVHFKFLKDIAYKAMSIVLSLVAISIIASFFLDYYLITARNNHEVKHMLVPKCYLASTGKYVYEKTRTPPVHEEIGLDSALKKKTDRKNLIVVIVGETARSANYELNGYNKPTNKFTRDLGVISFKDVKSCGTSTMYSVPCMFSFLGQENFSRQDALYQDNVIDVIKRAGFDILWLENDSGCKGVCNRVENFDISEIVKNKDKYCEDGTCKDGIFLENLETQINKLKANNSVLVMHIIGSHGPTYHKRFFEDKAEFFPYCKKNDVQNCSKEELFNAYDNTILYTDYIMSEVIKTLEKHHDLNTALVYVSDHGESLGENGVYLHGIPYSMAPEEQKTVPMILWLSENILKENRYDKRCLAQKASDMSFSHDNLPHTLLNITNIQTQLYKPELDIFNSCIYSSLNK
jgi:lipid A ethanolaminephosphotransferase